MAAALHVGDCAVSGFFRFLRSFAKSSTPLVVKPGAGVSWALPPLSEPAAVARALLQGGPAAQLLGVTPLEQAEVVDVFAGYLPPGGEAALQSLEARLRVRSYAAGARFTAADALCVFAVAPALAALPAGAPAARFPEVARWLRQLYAEAPALLGAEGAPPAVALPAPRPLAEVLAAAAAAGEAAPPAKAAQGKAAPGEQPPAAAAAAAAAAGGEGAAVAAAVPPPPAKKAKEAKAPAAPAEPPAERSPLSEMDFGVGVIVEAWPHPESDKLWCEKISFGPGEPVREIASGLRAHFSHAEMVSRRVVVVRNLKSRKLAGFASNGMVLCATGPGDNGRVEFVEPPEGAQLGERVRFAGHEGAAAEPNRVDKKKVRRARSVGGRGGEGGGGSRSRALVTRTAPNTHTSRPFRTRAALRGGRARPAA